MKFFDRLYKVSRFFSPLLRSCPILCRCIDGCQFRQTRSCTDQAVYYKNTMDGRDGQQNTRHKKILRALFYGDLHSNANFAEAGWMQLCWRRSSRPSSCSSLQEGNAGVWLNWEPQESTDCWTNCWWYSQMPSWLQTLYLIVFGCGCEAYHCGLQAPVLQPPRLGTKAVKLSKAECPQLWRQCLLLLSFVKVSPSSIVVANCGDCRCVMSLASSETETTPDALQFFMLWILGFGRAGCGPRAFLGSQCPECDARGDPESSVWSVAHRVLQELRRVLAAGGTITPDKRVTIAGAPGRLVGPRDFWIKIWGVQFRTKWGTSNISIIFRPTFSHEMSNAEPRQQLEPLVMPGQNSRWKFWLSRRVRTPLSIFEKNAR